MSRKLVLIITLVVLIGMLGVATKIQRAKASEYIIIKVDGSIDPPTAPISSVDNITYVLTDNIYDTILVVYRDDIVVDGAGCTLQGSRVFESKGINIGPLGSSNVTIRNMKIEDFFFGIYLFESSNNITNNTIGIWLHTFSAYNSISGNNITNNNDGIMFNDSSNNNISGNNITNNNDGIMFNDSSNNNIYHNNFINNHVQAYPLRSSNTWDNGVEGNYWSNYTGVDSNHDGIGDSWVQIDENNTDHYPLMGLFSSFSTSLGYNVNIISNSSIEDFEYFKANGTIRVHVFNMTANQTYGFCRLCIPKGLMPPPYTVIIDHGSTEVLYFNDTINGNGTHKWIYFSHAHSTHEIDIIPEFPASLILPLFLITTLLAVTAYRKRKSTLQV